MSSFQNVLYILNMSSIRCVCTYSQSCSLSFLTVPFTEVLNFNKIKETTSFSNPRQHSFPPVFYSNRFIVLYIILRSMIYKSVRSGSWFTFYFCIWTSNYSSIICWKLIFSPLNCLCSFIKDQLTIFVWVNFWAFYSAPLIYVSVYPFTNEQSWLLKLYKSWNWEVWLLQLGSFSVLGWTLPIFFFKASQIIQSAVKGKNPSLPWRHLGIKAMTWILKSSSPAGTFLVCR